MTQLSFTKYLSEKTQKAIFEALSDLNAAFDKLEEKTNDAFTLIDETWSELEDEHGEDHPFSNLLHSLKAHIEEITSSFDVTENFNETEKEAFNEWYESMMGGTWK